MAGLAAGKAMPVPVQLTLKERWAINASDSQFNALSGAIGGFTSGIVTCPLDVIKTKLQAQGGFARHGAGHHPRIYKGLFGTASVIWNQEGLRGLYRGLGPIIMGYLPTWAVWFTVYNKSKLFLGEYHRRLLAQWMGKSALVLTRRYRQLICGQLLVVHHSRGQQHHSHEPDLGYQNPSDVTIYKPR